MKRLLIYAPLLFITLFALMTGAFLPGTAAAQQNACTLTMGTSPDYPPYESVDAKYSGEIIGMDIDIARTITGQLGCELIIESIDFSGLIAALQSGRVDFVMSGMSVTEERKQSVTFSAPYYTARNTIVSHYETPYDSIEALRGKTVGAQLGSVQQFAAEDIEGAQVKTLNKITDLIQELNSKRIDAAIVEDAVAAEMHKANEHLTLSYLPASEEDGGYAIAFPLGSQLVSDFNDEMTRIKQDGTLDQIIDRWFAEGASTASQATGLIDFSVLKGYVPYILDSRQLITRMAVRSPD